MKRKSVVILTILFTGIAVSAAAQQKTDSLRQGVRSYVNRNFNKTRTFNLYTEQTFDHDYTLRRDGEKIEQGKIDKVRNVRFSATVPILLKRRFSIFANAQSDFYKFDAINKIHESRSFLFSDDNDGYNYYKGTISAAYRTRLFTKPVILNTTIGGDGWSGDFGKVQGTFYAFMMLHNSHSSNFSAGFYARTLCDKLPVIPIVTYWHQFSNSLGIDVILPHRIYLRYLFHDNHRLSIGASLGSEGYYMRTSEEGLPSIGYFSKTTFKPEMVYEFIINERFFLIVRGGGVGTLKSGLYGKNRKGVGGDPYIKFSQPMTGFLNLGISYNLFGK